MHAVYPLGIDFHTRTESHAGPLEVGGVAVLVSRLDEVMQMVDESQRPCILGGDLVLCGQLDTLLVQGRDL